MLRATQNDPNGKLEMIINGIFRDWNENEGRCAINETGKTRKRRTKRRDATRELGIVRSRKGNEKQKQTYSGCPSAIEQNVRSKHTVGVCRSCADEQETGADRWVSSLEGMNGRGKTGTKCKGQQPQNDISGTRTERYVVGIPGLGFWAGGRFNGKGTNPPVQTTSPSAILIRPSGAAGAVRGRKSSTLRLDCDNYK
ncbi:hypothetical protein C8R43DRAFT_1110347 [Mycena crocata]|nr:hypothetical protein C8R43DRAFT_1110347 [Mycena crocata]